MVRPKEPKKPKKLQDKQYWCAKVVHVIGQEPVLLTNEGTLVTGVKLAANAAEEATYHFDYHPGEVEFHDRMTIDVEDSKGVHRQFSMEAEKSWRGSEI